MDAAAGSDDSLKEELARLREENRALRAASKEDNAALAGLRAALEGAPARAAAWCPTVPAPDAGLGPAEVKRMVTTNLPTEFGTFQIMIFQSGSKHARCDRDGEIALVYGGLENVQREGGAAGGGGALVRIHSSCFTGDVLGSHRCDCGEQLQTSMQLVANHGCGVVVYLHQEGRGIGLLQKLKAYNLQETGLDTLDANLALGHPADAREYKTAVAILTDLGINTVKLLTNNPTKVTEMEAAGLTVAERVPIIAQRITADNYRYLQAKAERMNHELGARFLKAAEDAVPLGTALPWDKEASASPEKAAEAAAEEAVLPQDRPAVLYSNKPPFPVVAVNDLWLETCGFRREEVLGKTMRLIQGPLTEGAEVGRLMDTIYLASMQQPDPDSSPKWAPPSAAMWTGGDAAAGGAPPKAVSASLINYSKDRKAMRNDLEVIPVGGPTPDGAAENLLSISTFTPLDPAVQRALESTDDLTAAAAEDIKAVEECLAAYKAGGMVLVADDEGRENEGDLIVAAELVTEQQVAFMVQHCTGIVCCAMSEEICDRLKLPLMVEQNEEYFGTKFCVTVDGGPQMGVTTGVSAWDRATTIRALANPETQPTELVRPGHIFPLRYTAGGVLTRGGHTEASVDLSIWCGLQPAGCICELVKPGDGMGGMARRDDMASFATTHSIPCITIRQMQVYAKARFGGERAAGANQKTYADDGSGRRADPTEAVGGAEAAATPSPPIATEQ